MKKILIIFTLLTSLQLTGCKKDEIKSDNTFSLDQLYQTGWSGKLTTYHEGKSKEDKYKILFSTKKYGSFQQNADISGGFQYRFEGKLIEIFSLGGSHPGNIMFGDYMLLNESTKDKIIFKSSFVSDSFYQILELQRTY